MKASDYIVRFLFERGVRNVFELSGGMITHLLNSLSEFKQISVVSMHHEQAASFAADATGRLNPNIPGIALATSGPGAINLLAGIASCYFDSIPAVFITGQVPTNELTEWNSSLRQTGFQETDIVGMAAPITKQTWRVLNAADLPSFLHQAFRIALEGRPGPVLIDIPFDIQASEIGPYELYDFTFKRKHTQITNEAWTRMFLALTHSDCPLILAGNGIRMGDAVEEFRNFVTATKIPVVHSLLGKDLLPFNHKLNVGLIGSYGNRWANKALAECDFLLVLGSRLDIKQTGSNCESFTRGRIIYHVDIEREVINSRVPDCNPIVMELKSFLLDGFNNYHLDTDWPIWKLHIYDMAQQYFDQDELVNVSGINPNVFMHRLSGASVKAATYVVDTGQNQMWAAQSLDLFKHQRFLTSGGLGAMGYALPAAIGAAIETKAPVVCIVGDGGMQCNIQELETIRRNNLPIKIVVLNNHCHGMVRQFQESYFKGNYQSTVKGYSAPSFCGIASAYNILSYGICKTKSDIENGLNALWRHFPNEPFLLEVEIDQMLNVRPKLPFGNTLDNME